MPHKLRSVTFNAKKNTIFVHTTDLLSNLERICKTTVKDSAD